MVKYQVDYVAKLQMIFHFHFHFKVIELQVQLVVVDLLRLGNGNVMDCLDLDYNEESHILTYKIPL